MLTLVLALFQYLLALLHRAWRKPSFRPYRQVPCPQHPSFHRRRKPEWVRREIVHLAALLSRPTCRAIADIFSRRFAQRRKMRVGRTFVNGVLRAKRYDIEVERRRIKNARPKAVPRNLVWGMDLTRKTDSGAQLHPVLGLVDHGARANLSLVALANKSSFTLRPPRPGRASIRSRSASRTKDGSKPGTGC